MSHFSFHCFVGVEKIGTHFHQMSMYFSCQLIGCQMCSFSSGKEFLLLWRRLPQRERIKRTQFSFIVSFTLFGVTITILGVTITLLRGSSITLLGVSSPILGSPTRTIMDISFLKPDRVTACILSSASYSAVCLYDHGDCWYFRQIFLYTKSLYSIHMYMLVVYH